MADIQFYRINQSCDRLQVLEPAFRRRLSDSGPRQLDPLAMAAVDLPTAAGKTVTLMSYDIPQGPYFAPLNGEDPNHYGFKAEDLLQVKRRPLRRPARAVSAALPGAVAAGARISTSEGCRPIESLRLGDQVTTYDGRPARIRWIGRATHVARGGFAPLTLCPSAFGVMGPVAQLSVSAQQPVLVTGARAELFFGAEEVIAPAGELPECARMDGAGPLDIVTYYTLLLDQQELIRAEGLWIASFHPADATDLSFDADMRAEISDLMPALAAGGPAAYGPHIRPMAASLASRHAPLGIAFGQ